MRWPFSRSCRITSINDSGSMGGAWLSPAVLDRLLPYKNAFICITAVTFLFAALVVVENVLYITANERYAWLLLIPYALSWVLMIVGFSFLHIATRIVGHGKKRTRRHTAAYHGDGSNSRSASPTASMMAQQQQGAIPYGQPLPLSPYLVCDGPQIFLSTPYLGYASFPQGAYPVSPGAFPMMSPGYQPCELRVPSPVSPSMELIPEGAGSGPPLLAPSPLPLLPPPPLRPSTATSISPNPPTYLEAIRGTGPLPAEPREE